MTQTAQTEQAKGDLLLAGTLQGKDLMAFLQTYSISHDTPPNAPMLMLLEKQPHHVVQQDERQDLLYFAFFDPTFDFTPYTSGRIFHEQGELRWERQHSSVQIVYTGYKEYKPEGLQDAKEIMLDAYTPKDRAYFLFGKRLDEAQRDRIGPVAQSGDFAEVRIPRLLRYPKLPTLEGAERVQLVICEYIVPATALTFAYRFKTLVRFQKQSETTGAK